MCYLAANYGCNLIGPMKVKNLLMLYALKGCNNTVSFVGHGKETAQTT